MKSPTLMARTSRCLGVIRRRSDSDTLPTRREDAGSGAGGQDARLGVSPPPFVSAARGSVTPRPTR
jgi:hypothetical protein